MSAYNSPELSGFVRASSLDSRGERVCPQCGKQYDDDGRARAAYLRHVADCLEELEKQTSLAEWGAFGDATDAEVREAILEGEADR